MNQTLRFGTTTVVVHQVSVVNYGPFRRFYVRYPFSHLIWALSDRIQNSVEGLLYFYGPFPVTPSQSRVTISAEIRYVPEAGTPDLAFSLEGCQDASPDVSVEGTNVIFQDVLTGHIPWTQERFVLTITDRKTGISQTAILRPAKWKTARYKFGDLGAPKPPEAYPVLSDFFNPFSKFLYEGGHMEWKNCLIPDVKDTFPWRRMEVKHKGKVIVPGRKLYTWEGSRPGFENVYYYELQYWEELAMRPFARQKLYFVRWDDTWKVLDVDPLQRETP